MSPWDTPHLQQKQKWLNLSFFFEYISLFKDDLSHYFYVDGLLVCLCTMYVPDA